MTAPRTLGVHHVGLTVEDLNATVHFFVEHLRFKTLGEMPSYPAAFISDGTSTLTLWQAASPQSATPFDRKNNLGLHHLALRVTPETLDALGRELVALRSCTVEFGPELSHGGPARHMMVCLPGSGIRLELRADS
jgi:catechol 2,3-dioxygenase-like lactoylglutathione lyase family enzyme